MHHTLRHLVDRAIAPGHHDQVRAPFNMLAGNAAGRLRPGGRGQRDMMPLIF